MVVVFELRLLVLEPTNDVVQDRSLIYDVTVVTEKDIFQETVRSRCKFFENYCTLIQNSVS